MARRESLRRLVRRALVAAALLTGAVVVFAGCRQGRDHVSLDRIELADLSAMVVPRDGMGAPALGLELSGSSGWKQNRAAAGDTLDPDDTARSLARSGRLGGYELTYNHPRGYTSRYEERPLVMSTEVELFRDEATASAYLRNAVEMAMRLRGRKLPEGKLANVHGFDAGDVGDESEGLRAALRIADRAVYVSTIGFRRGRIVASVSSAHRAEIGGPADLQEIAATLDDRITGVATGALRKAAVKLPRPKWWHAVPDPLPLTLEARELVGGAKLTHRTYYRTPVNFSFIRNYDLRRARLGASRIIYLRTMASSFKNVRAAARERADMASDSGSGKMARAFLRAFFRKSGASPTDVDVRRLPPPARGAAAFRFSFGAPAGRVAGVMLGVGRRRLRANAIVLGLERELRTQDVLDLRGKLLARLASG